MFTSVTVLFVLVSVFMNTSLLLKIFRPTQERPTRGIIPCGLAWEGLFPFLGSRPGTGARFAAACRRPADFPYENRRAGCAACLRCDFTFCFWLCRLPRQRSSDLSRRSAHLSLVSRWRRRQAAAF